MWTAWSSGQRLTDTLTMFVIWVRSGALPACHACRADAIYTNTTATVGGPYAPLLPADAYNNQIVATRMTDTEHAPMFVIGTHTTNGRSNIVSVIIIIITALRRPLMVVARKRV